MEPGIYSEHALVPASSSAAVLLATIFGLPILSQQVFSVPRNGGYSLAGALGVLVRHKHKDDRTRAERVSDYVNNARVVSRRYRKRCAVAKYPPKMRSIRGILYEVNSGLHALWKEMKK